MGLRQRMLPAGWYPASPNACVSEIESFIAGVKPLPAGAKVYGGMLPHAGWYFSGKLAARVFHLNAQVTQPQVVCIFGGHLGGNSPPLLVTDDAWQTPLGDAPLATEFYKPLLAKIPLKPELPGDNTIEDKMIIEEKLIASAVQDNDPHTRENAIEALMKSKPLVAIGPFIQIATHDSDEDVRARALYALADYLEDPNLPKQYFDQVLNCLRHVRDQNDSPYLQRLARGVITLHEVK